MFSTHSELNQLRHIQIQTLWPHSALDLPFKYTNNCFFSSNNSTMAYKSQKQRELYQGSLL